MFLKTGNWNFSSFISLVWHPRWVSQVISVSLGLIILGHLVFTNLSNTKRRIIIESEILSIYCCSVLWKIVELTLKKTEKEMKKQKVEWEKNKKFKLQSFLEILSKNSAEWKNHIFTLPTENHFPDK